MNSLSDFKNPFFIGIAGTGMSALAQYLKGTGHHVSGSDRYFKDNEYNETRSKLEAEGIRCFVQDGRGITKNTDLIVASTAIEETVLEIRKAKEQGIPIMRRSELLALIASSKKTIAVGGTSGKSTTSAMLFDILSHAGLGPGIISGAGLVSLINKGKIGNAHVGEGEWLVIEADESDGSIVQYKPEIGLVLNVDKDHKDLDTLMEIFETFKSNSKYFVVNQSHPLSRKLSVDRRNDFSTDAEHPAGYMAKDFVQNGMQIRFKVQDTLFTLHTVGKHNMENALAAIAISNFIGVSLDTAAEAILKYEGIHRRHQLLGKKGNVWVIDDYAHNPVKCAASIQACQPIAPKVVAWFQPHGYAPTKFLRDDFVQEIAAALRAEDEIWMSEIFYAGGTTTKDISANDLITDLRSRGKQAFFAEDRNQLVDVVRPRLTGECVLLLMGARDPSLEQFGKQVFEKL